MPQRVPAAGVLAEEPGAVGLVEPRPELRDPEAETVHPGSPVAGRRLDAGQVLRDPRAQVVESSAPVGDVGDGGRQQARWRACGQPAVAGDRPHGAVVAAAGCRQREGDVDHGQSGADDQDVGRSGGGTSYDVQRAGCPRVADEERRPAQLLGSPVVPSGRQSGGHHDRVPDELAAVGGGDDDTGGRAPDRPCPPVQVLERGVAGGVADGRGQRLVEVAAVLPARRERVGPGGRDPRVVSRTRSGRGPRAARSSPRRGRSAGVGRRWCRTRCPDPNGRQDRGGRRRPTSHDGPRCAPGGARPWSRRRRHRRRSRVAGTPSQSPPRRLVI